MVKRMRPLRADCTESTVTVIPKGFNDYSMHGYDYNVVMVHS